MKNFALKKCNKFMKRIDTFDRMLTRYLQYQGTTECRFNC